MDEQRRREDQEQEPGLKRPDDTVEDLEPEQEKSEAVKGGWSGPGGDRPTES